jgi:hypothetical protein
MSNNTDTIPWLVYRGIRLVQPVGEGWDENEYGHHHIIRVRVDESVRVLRANAFAYCMQLRQIQIPGTVALIGHHAFYQCYSLETIEITSQLRTVEWNAFQFCHSLASIWLPDSVNMIGSRAFHSCSALNSVRLPRDLQRIRYSTFYRCSSLATFEIPRSVIVIERLAFSYCDSLQTVRMSVSSKLSRIRRDAFFCCPSLTEIDVGTLAVNLWPRLLRQLDSDSGLFGNHSGIDQKKRTSFVLSFLKKHGTQLFKGGTTAGGRGIIRKTLVQQT